MKGGNTKENKIETPNGGCSHCHHCENCSTKGEKKEEMIPHRASGYGLFISIGKLLICSISYIVIMYSILDYIYGIKFILLEIGLFIINLTLIIKLHKTNPGYQTSNKMPFQIYQLLPSNLTIGRSKCKPPYCHVCGIIKEVGTVHCKHCNLCVKKYDHHCGYLSNCITRQNEKLFILFLLTVMMNVSLICGTTYYYWNLYYDVVLELNPKLEMLKKLSIFSGISFVLSVLFLLRRFLIMLIRLSEDNGEEDEEEKKK